MRKKANDPVRRGPFPADFLVLLACAPAETWILEDATRIVGFYQSFGVTAPSPRAAAAAASRMLLAGGGRLIRVESVRRIDRATLDPAILERSGLRSGRAWYRSGRVLFQDATIVEPEG